MKKILVALSLVSSIGFAQNNSEMPYLPGEVLVMVDDNAFINKVVQQNAIVNGVSTEISVKKKVSEPANIWLLSFDEAKISHERILEKLRSTPHVQIVQNNHIVHDRATTTNDPGLSDQWHHINPNDSDIDSDLAWDITTGGTTATGDEIVVCVLEGGGSDWDHPDLIANHWVNSNEIPNNNIDDDGNGYVDDYNGWNEPDGDDVISPGSHGTQVSGMIGAVGNNGSVVTGINWDVKIMQVQNTNTLSNEAAVVAAYTYPLVMRQLYESTSGSKGAFVVATNASWGIDGGDPNSAPIWCAFYDTLGTYGILNCGATTNTTGFDVDAGGDLPTACSSDYMISVTRTGNNDQMGGGHGLTTIDLGAPGISVYTTSNGGGYGSTTGTSFSSPLTAGVIALLYSVPCASLAQLSHANPQAAADQVRSALLDGVDPISSLSGKAVTGGRLNAFNSVNEIIANCSATSCLDPWQVASSNITDVQADIAWGGTGTSYNFRYREVGTTTWTTGSAGSTSTQITGLTACTDYEIQIQSVCTSATDTSNFTTSHTFSTDGCCVAPASHSVSNVTSTGADITWTSVLAANSYNLRYREQSTSTWTTVNGVSSPHNLNTLNGCTDYEVQVETVCSGGPTGFTASENFTTMGCGACLDMTYCASEGTNTSDEWIESVVFESISNTSGNDDGYGDYTGVSTDVLTSATYSITMTPGFSGFPYPEYFNVWIDFNHDGDFDDANEHAFDAGGTSSNAVNGNISIPFSAVLGVTKMRVSMKYNGAATSCATGTADFEYGEVEDYCINILQGNDISEYGDLDFTIYPNPANDQIQISSSFTGPVTMNMLNSLGQTIDTKLIQSQELISIENMAKGVYFIKLTDENGKFGIKRLIIQ